MCYERIRFFIIFVYSIIFSLSICGQDDTNIIEIEFDNKISNFNNNIVSIRTIDNKIVDFITVGNDSNKLIISQNKFLFGGAIFIENENVNYSFAIYPDTKKLAINLLNDKFSGCVVERKYNSCDGVSISVFGENCKDYNYASYNYCGTTNNLSKIEIQGSSNFPRNYYENLNYMNQLKKRFDNIISSISGEWIINKSPNYDNSIDTLKIFDAHEIIKFDNLVSGYLIGVARDYYRIINPESFENETAKNSCPSIFYLSYSEFPIIKIVNEDGISSYKFRFKNNRLILKNIDSSDRMVFTKLD